MGRPRGGTGDDGGEVDEAELKARLQALGLENALQAHPMGEHWQACRSALMAVRGPLGGEPELRRHADELVRDGTCHASLRVEIARVVAEPDQVYRVGALPLLEALCASTKMTPADDGYHVAILALALMLRVALRTGEAPNGPIAKREIVALDEQISQALLPILNAADWRAAEASWRGIAVAAPWLAEAEAPALELWVFDTHGLDREALDAGVYQWRQDRCPTMSINASEVILVDACDGGCLPPRPLGPTVVWSAAVEAPEGAIRCPGEVPLRPPWRDCLPPRGFNYVVDDEPLSGSIAWPLVAVLEQDGRRGVPLPQNEAAWNTWMSTARERALQLAASYLVSSLPPRFR